MEHLKKALQLRKQIKARKRNFVVRESNFSPRIKARWRNPRGTHSAIRQKHRGRPNLVGIGYGGPKLVRNLHSSGLEKVLVHNAKELLAIDSHSQGAVIASSTGKKRKQELFQLALEKKIRVLNFKDLGKSLEKIKADLAVRKGLKEKKKIVKSKKEEEKKKKAEDKKKEAEKKTEEEKKSPEHKSHNVQENKEQDSHQITKEQ